MHVHNGVLAMEFVKENVNPKGWRTGDCVVRAIAKASSLPWEEVYKDLCEIGLKKCRMPNDPKVYELYLENHGWFKCKQPRKHDGRKFKVREFLDDFYFWDKWCIISMANHLSCACEGTLYDTWNCSYLCVGNYWVRKENE